MVQMKHVRFQARSLFPESKGFAAQRQTSEVYCRGESRQTESLGMNRNGTAFWTAIS